MQSLQQALEAGNPGKVTLMYYVRLPTEEAHHMCHPTKGAMGFSQRIHPELITKIHELVQTGVTDPTVVQRLLRSHVHSQMHTNPPDPNDRSYFPMVDDVRYGNTIALMDATAILVNLAKFAKHVNVLAHAQ